MDDGDYSELFYCNLFYFNLGENFNTILWPCFFYDTVTVLY